MNSLVTASIVLTVLQQLPVLYFFQGRYSLGETLVPQLFEVVSLKDGEIITETIEIKGR